ncbi:hypothetical protein [Listeria grandensis]|nr:hypothetical protein [Listeria grandensis]
MVQTVIIVVDFYCLSVRLYPATSTFELSVYSVPIAFTTPAIL